MGFLARHMMWIYGLGAIVVVYFLYRTFSTTSNQPSAADVASAGTLSPGTSVYADTGGSVGYGVPGQSTTYTDSNSALNAALLSSILNSGANSTAPSNQGAVSTVADATALGTASGTGTSTIGAYSGGSANTNAASATAITMPDLSAVLPADANQSSSTLGASTAPAYNNGWATFGGAAGVQGAVNTTGQTTSTFTSGSSAVLTSNPYVIGPTSVLG